MTQSLCARCLGPLPRQRRQPGKILCDACESAWRRDFDRGLHHHLGKPGTNRAPAAADDRPAASTSTSD